MFILILVKILSSQVLNNKIYKFRLQTEIQMKRSKEFICNHFEYAQVVSWLVDRKEKSMRRFRIMANFVRFSFAHLSLGKAGKHLFFATTIGRLDPLAMFGDQSKIRKILWLQNPGDARKRIQRKGHAVCNETMIATAFNLMERIIFLLCTNGAS